MITLTDLKASQSVIDDLAWPFDFNVDRAARDNSWIKLMPNKPFIVLAGDSTGGVFVAYGDGAVEQLPILHATSEGQAGCIADNLTELLAIMMAAPYWLDLLKFSGGGDLNEMRRTAVFMQEENADLSSARERIMNALPIPVISDPVKVVHDRIHATDCTLVADDGWHYETLFNNFVSSDNPSWR